MAGWLKEFGAKKTILCSLKSGFHLVWCFGGKCIHANIHICTDVLA